jgi:alkylation response protein AidB-like acyl-CoA dehydrogenase
MDLSWTAADEALRRDLRTWLSDHRPPTPTTPALADVVDAGRRWQAALADGRWVAVTWPVEHGGRGLGASANLVVHQELARAGAPELVGRIGVNLVGPTLLAHGTDAQCRRWLPGIASAAELWCQLFSEPDAGSDLGSLTTRAEAVADGWVVSGRKVWTSYAQFADLGLCLARTTPGSRGPRGLSMLVIDMHAEGVTVRPLVQMTGDAEFNEVTLDQVHVPTDHLIGPEGDGWTVARATLARERGINPRQLVLHLQRLDDLWRRAAASGAVDDPAWQRRLARAAEDVLVFELHTWRAVARAEAGRAPGAESSVVKVHWSEASVRLHRLALDILGPAATLWHGATGAVDDGAWARAWLYAQASTIFSGTNEIQRTLVGEGVLGLPKEPRVPLPPSAPGPPVGSSAAPAPPAAPRLASDPTRR